MLYTASARGATPEPFDVLRDSQLLAVFYMPALYIAMVLGRRLIPLTAFAFAALVVFGHLLVPLLPYAAAVAVAVGVVIALLVKLPSLDAYRRRMLIYGVAIVVVCDYRILRIRCKGLDAEEAEFLWQRAHQRYGEHRWVTTRVVHITVDMTTHEYELNIAVLVAANAAVSVAVNFAVHEHGCDYRYEHSFFKTVMILAVLRCCRA